MAKIADQYLLIDPWKIIEEGYRSDKSEVSESLFSLSNEHMGVRGYFDEGYSGSSLVGCYLNGIYEEHFLKEPVAYKGISNRICFMVNTVNWLYTRIEVGGESLDLNHSRFSNFRRELDFKTGELRRELVWKTEKGCEIKLVFSRFLSMQTKEMGFQRISLTALNFSGPVSITLGMDFSIQHETYGQNFWDCPQKAAHDGLYTISGVSQNIRHKLFAGFKILSEVDGEKASIVEDRFVGCRFALNLVQGQERRLDRLAILYTTRDPAESAEATWAQGMALLEQRQTSSYHDSLHCNAAYWQKFWDKSDIAVEGDPEAQQGIRFCTFQMQQTYRGVIDGANIGSKGLTGEAYNGNAFWDTETYCLPYYIFSNPTAAKALLDFRYKTLPQALSRAKDLDCSGACYPVATIDGEESCTLWQHASLQLQPTTSVAYAIWHYVKITQDNDFLFTRGVEILLQICRFLASRGQWSPRRNKFGYYAVMGPDEFQMMVNNNCYTNFMARQTFLYTLQVLADMQSLCPEQKTGLLERLACTPDELAAWQNLASHMIIPYDPETGVYEQHEGFFDLPHIDIDAIPVEDFPLYYNWSYDRIYRNDMIKQPDVLMFMFLYNQSFSREAKRTNYDYYEPRCIHESSLSPSLHSIFAAELGLKLEAYEFFKFATRIDLDNYNRNTAEGIHITSIAAAWMNVVYGYGGMRSDGDRLVFNPTIPPHWQAYRFQIVYRNSTLQVSVDQKQACIRLLDGDPVTAVICGEVREINRNGLVSPIQP
ncbi:MAG: family 65 glycosyl hydrolase [Chloroflexota bacterium]|nr:MAG: family 65 glycosyl hydrolase [Chloroflexota bacterium]